MQVINSLGKYQLVPLFFSQDNVADSQTAVALYTTEVASAAGVVNVGYTMPFAGEIIGVSANLDTAATTGTLTIVPTIAGTAASDPSVAITTAAVGSDTCRRGTNNFAANAVIGAKITTSGWNGTSSDLNVIVWVLLKISGI
jgi:hypothetical protein